VSAAVVVALCWAAFTALALALERHHAQVFGAPAARRRERWGWRSAGVALLVAAATAAVGLDGPGVGLVLWCGALTIAGLGVSAVLAWRPTAALHAGGTALVAALLLGALL
jgi:hypothetical protein